MFTRNSRYFGLPTVAVTTTDGRQSQAVKLRRLPITPGDDYQIHDGDQLDVMSDRRYRDPTRYWYVADANSELEAEELVRRAGRVIKVPTG